MKKKILKTIREHNLITEGMHIVLGLSGGPDSVCLFSVLTELAGEMNLTLHPVHINHRFRPGAAEEDQAYVEELCRSNGLSCRSFVYDCPAMAREQKLTPEEAGRKARYEAFFKVAGEIHASGVPASKIAVAVAQNANDQCETILFRILRGTGTDGLSGIAYKRKGQGGFHVIRPLLDITRDEIEKYCADRNLNPRIDHTNSETVYTRNRIRLELIPYLADNFNSNIVETVNRLGRIAA
ncbi:MAG: tRNA lysidine(34) synthetase TilS, partial [Firmicutes bacterium]|nr:tRNA lysidine(34) synthetase TilS [Bacillota bacterium]